MDINKDFVVTGSKDGLAIMWKLYFDGKTPQLRKVK